MQNTHKKPNIVWIYTDEQRYDSLQCMGTPWVRTPNLDRLASEGALFTNHHINAPQCTPSRVSAFSGKYPHETGVMDISAMQRANSWQTEDISFPELFERAGYQTVNYGKVHTPEDHPVFQKNEEFVQFEDEVGYFQISEEFDEAELEVIRSKPGHIISGRYPYVLGGRTPATYLTDKAVDWLQERKRENSTQPFVLSVSYNWPHTPVMAPEPFYSMYDPEKIDCSWWQDALQEPLTTYNNRFMKADLTEQQLQRVWATYFGCVTHLDEQFGRIIRELEVQGLRDNTIIVFTSDHGSLQGEHSLFQKGMFYRESTQVPFILNWRGGIEAGGVCTGVTEQIDLAPTLLALAGLEIPRDYSGRSIVVDGKPIAGKPAVYSELHLHNMDGVAVAPHRISVRTNDFLLNLNYREITGELSGAAERDGFLADLSKDPKEQHNVYGDPAYTAVQHELEQQVLAWVEG